MTTPVIYRMSRLRVWALAAEFMLHRTVRRARRKNKFALRFAIWMFGLAVQLWLITYGAILVERQAVIAAAWSDQLR